MYLYRNLETKEYFCFAENKQMLLTVFITKMREERWVKRKSVLEKFYCASIHRKLEDLRCSVWARRTFVKSLEMRYHKLEFVRLKI